MVRRRSLFDPFASTAERRWLVVRNQHGAIVESREIAAGVDLKRLFIASMLEWIDGGWTVCEFSSASAAFFCTGVTERCMVAIEAEEPRGSGWSSPSHLMSPLTPRFAR
jgi:hypothetical protein